MTWAQGSLSLLLFLSKISCSQQWVGPPTSEQSTGRDLYLQKALSLPKPPAQWAKRRGDRSSEGSRSKQISDCSFFDSKVSTPPAILEKMLCTAASLVILISVFVRSLLYIWISKLCIWSSKLSIQKHCQTWLDSNRIQSKGIV